MSIEPNTERLLAEIRDLLATREQIYMDHIAECERLYKEQVTQARQRAIWNRAVQWAALFVVVYFAVSLALKHNS